ncbi:Ferritin-like domain [Teratosphaeria destructans]|uniref:Ferritin-like domain n=1 Tax=Teratosphaeria destructans TaxID=418781 RepID=A0A9W7ST08_9PEZI|nr:Ferritin-like domain [Teratosphaeria destructans]
MKTFTFTIALLSAAAVSARPHAQLSYDNTPDSYDNPPPKPSPSPASYDNHPVPPPKPKPSPIPDSYDDHPVDPSKPSPIPDPYNDHPVDPSKPSPIPDSYDDHPLPPPTPTPTPESYDNHPLPPPTPTPTPESYDNHPLPPPKPSPTPDSYDNHPVDPSKPSPIPDSYDNPVPPPPKPTVPSNSSYDNPPVPSPSPGPGPQPYCTDCPHPAPPSNHTRPSIGPVVAYGQTPFSFPLDNGFPNVSSNALLEIEKAAHGTLPNGPLPNKLNDVSLIVLGLIAFNEFFEVAFFSSVIKNITDGIDGFTIPDKTTSSAVLEALTVVRAQEELHALGANALRVAAGAEAIQPCEYVFPSSDLASAMRFASTFTDLVLGALQDVQGLFATNGDGALVPLIGSVIGQEGEQNGYYRSFLNLVPSSQPFLTGSVGRFAWSALNQLVVVPDSCPNKDLLPIPQFDALTVVTTDIQLVNQVLTFSVISNVTAEEAKTWHVTYINGQNLPVTVPVCHVHIDGCVITFEAQFDAEKILAYGLTIAAVTKSAGPFPDIAKVADDTLFAPGLIEIK